MLLLPRQNLLLILSEDGELALVRATPDAYTEIARVPALAGKTWNHPVLVGDTLLVRNGEENGRVPHRRAGCQHHRSLTCPRLDGYGAPCHHPPTLAAATPVPRPRT
ncbi:MAG: hypothetical protein R2712_08490 [Vicinamibacterales bacterium]